jgi:hypothetical protein
MHSIVKIALAAARTQKYKLSAKEQLSTITSL